MKNLAFMAGTLALGLAAVLYAPAFDVSGHVQVTGRRGRADVTTVVFAESLEGPTPLVPGQYQLTQRDKTFTPHVLVVPVGSKVEFPNLDPIFHNVFSLSPPEPFDLGLYRAGASKTRTFTKPARYQVFCNIHPQMNATILVLPTSLFTQTGPEGNFRLGVPAGRYRLTAWSERSAPASMEVTVAQDQSVSGLTLDESKFVEMQHKNKFGQDYPKSNYDPLGRGLPK